MTKLDNIVARCKTSTMSVDKLCKIKPYLPTKEKFEFIEEYSQVLKKQIEAYPDYASFVAFVFFNLIVVKKYTDIELELTYEDFDKLQEAGLINKIIEVINEDYNLLLRMTQMNIKNDVKD